MIRIDRAARDPRELLDPENWISCQWGGDALRECRGCVDCSDSPVEKAGRCYGGREIEDSRYGVSVCRDEDALVDYLAHTGADMDNAVLIEIEGDWSDDEGHDAHIGEELVLPTRIISVRPVTDEFIERVFARHDEIGV